MPLSGAVKPARLLLQSRTDPDCPWDSKWGNALQTAEWAKTDWYRNCL